MRFCFLFLCFLSVAWATPKVPMFLSLLKQNEVGDFVVLRQGKLCHFVRIVENTPAYLSLEELTFPYDSAYNRHFREYYPRIREKALDHIVLKVDVANPAKYGAYSIKDKSHVQFEEKSSPLLELFSRRMVKLPVKDYRKIGPRPKVGPDNRKTFIPTFYLDGEKVESPSYAMFRITPPLGDKQITFYLFDNIAFPYWLSIESPSREWLRLTGIDAGKNFKENLPLYEDPPPFVVKAPQRNHNRLSVSLFIPPFQKIVRVTDNNDTPISPKEYSFSSAEKPFTLFQTDTNSVKTKELRIHLSGGAVLRIDLKPVFEYDEYYDFSDGASLETPAQNKKN